MQLQRQIRFAVLSRLYAHLRDVYDLEGGREAFLDGTVTLSELEGFLAFKSDPVIDELLSVLRRMETGTFGLCIGCKRKISTALLLKDPARRLCEPCEHDVVTYTIIEARQLSTAIS
jgi:hypothetical protein